MRRIALTFALVVAALTVAAGWWRGHRRIGSAYVNRVVNPWLVKRGVAEKSAGEIGLLEHVGRRTGTVHASPIHPVPIDGGFRIVVPLGLQSEWAKNVLAAGHARIQIGDFVHDVDEPVLLSPIEVEAIPPVAGHVLEWLGFRYLVLHEFAARAGTLEEPSQGGESSRSSPEPEPVKIGTETAPV